jgi:ATP-binding cassette subfamily F protein uup
MATQITARDLSKSFASRTLFTGVQIQLADGDRLGMIGPNGAGKSTLLKILAGLEDPDDGEIVRRRGLRVAYVPQDDEFPDDVTPRTAMAERLTTDRADERLDVDTVGATTLTKLGFPDVDQPLGTLSGGWRKRLSIGCAVALDPDVLMLDEPTNHLDLEGIVWLEQFVRQTRMTVVIITHDRRFLENAARRIIELSPAYPGGTFKVAGNYTEFARRKAEFLDSQQVAESALANKVRRDTAWLQQGIKARRTRNKSQLDDTRDREAELKAIRDRNAAPLRAAAIDFQGTERKTKKLLALHAVGKSMGGRKLFENLEVVLSPGRRIGLLGPNGSGKTTLLRLMAGELEPDEGTIKPAAELRIVTFTQHRCHLTPSETLQEALCPVGDMVDYRGRSIHVAGWAGRFLFTPDQLSTYVSHLSGGEQARLLIAKLMLEPADVLLLDEPTNDLDIPSLEVLEQALLEFPGAIVLVTHDRFMLERIATDFLEIEPPEPAASPARKPEPSERKPRPARSQTSPGKLSYKLQRDFDSMEERILDAEAEVERLEAEVADPAVMTDRDRHATVCQQLAGAQQAVQQLYDRWAELDAMRG